MTENARSPLKTVTLNAARSKEFPDGSIRHGYEFIAPLTPEGRIDMEGWKARRGECFVHRFWGDAPQQRGLLVHQPGGRGGPPGRSNMATAQTSPTRKTAIASAITSSKSANMSRCGKKASCGRFGSYRSSEAPPLARQHRRAG